MSGTITIVEKYVRKYDRQSEGRGTLVMQTSVIDVTSTERTNWNLAFDQTRQWDGGATGLVAATGRTSLDVYSKGEGDGRYLRQLQNLADLDNITTARTNLGANLTDGRILFGKFQQDAKLTWVSDVFTVDGKGLFQNDLEVGEKTKHKDFSLTTDFSGTNWEATKEGDFNIRNLVVRESARFRELIIDQLSVIAGSTLLSAARGKIESANNTTKTVTLEDPNDTNSCQFAVNDFFWIKSVDVDGGVFLDLKGQVTAVTNNVLTLDTTIAGGTHAAGTTNLSALTGGEVIVQRGHPTTAARQNLIYTTVSDADAPVKKYFTGIDSLAAFDTVTNIRVQTGNLVNAPAIGSLQPSGFGLFGQNAFLSGKIIVEGGDAMKMPTTNLDLAAHFKFDEGSGTAVIDDTGTVASGTITGATYVPGVSGTGLLFDDDAVTFANGTLGTAVNGRAAVSISAWINMNSYGGSVLGSILWARITELTGFLVSINPDGKLYTQARSVSTDLVQAATGNIILPLNQDIFVSAVFHFTNKTTTLYVDGELDSHHTGLGWTNNTYTQGTATIADYIGNANTANRDFDGMIDEVMLHKEAVSADKWRALYRSISSGDSTRTTIRGGLVTTGTLQVEQGGTVAAGITGNTSGDTAVRFWAGSTFANRATAPFRVQQDGRFFSNDGNISGWEIGATAISKIGGTDDKEKVILSSADRYLAFQYKDNGTFEDRIKIMADGIATLASVITADDNKTVIGRDGMYSYWGIDSYFYFRTGGGGDGEFFVLKGKSYLAPPEDPLKTNLAHIYLDNGTIQFQQASELEGIQLVNIPKEGGGVTSGNLRVYDSGTRKYVTIT